MLRHQMAGGIFISVLAATAAWPASVLAQTYSPPWTPSVVNSNIPGLEKFPLFLWNGFGGSTFDSNPTLRVDRDVETTSGGGIQWHTYPTIWALTTTGYASPGFEWSIVGELHNRTRKSAGAQNVAVNGTAFKEKADNGEETGTTWAGNFNCVDNNGAADPTTSCIGLELDVGGAVGTDANRQRVLSHAAGGGASGAHIAYGYMVSTSPGVTIDRAFSTANVGSTFGIGLDLAGASFSGAAILMAPEQWLAFDGTAAGGFQHFMGMHAGRVTIMSPYGPQFSMSDDGGVYLGRVIEQIPHVPASATSPCETGERAWDQSYEYRCISPSRWRRAALSDW